MIGNKYFIIGATGQLSKEFQKLFDANGFKYKALSSSYCNLTDRNSLREELYDNFIDQHNSIIINCGAFNDVDKAEEYKDISFKVNALGPKYLSEIANETNSKLIHFSSDFVFSGYYTWSFFEQYYNEFDKPIPVNYYGATKLQGEQYVKDICNNYLILRTAWLYGQGDNFITKFLSYNRGSTETVLPKLIGTPTYTKDVVNQTMLLLNNKAQGLYHCVAATSCSKKQFAEQFCKILGINIKIEEDDYILKHCAAARPQALKLENYQLTIENINIMRPWDEALLSFIKDNREYLENLATLAIHGIDDALNREI